MPPFPNPRAFLTISQTSTIKKQYKKQITSLEDEVRALTASSAESRAQTERAVREVKSIEEELDRVRREPMDEARRLTDELDQLRKRVLLAENERHDALNRATAAAVTEKKWAGQWNKEKTQMSNEMAELQRRLRRCDKEMGG